MTRFLQILLPAITALVILTFWFAAVRLGWVMPVVLPPPDRILQAIWENREAMLSASLATFYAAVLGFIAAVGGGFIIAMILASNRWIKASLHPLVLTVQMTPIIILTPIIGLWIEDALFRIIAITFLISFFPVVANTTLGLVSTDKHLLDLFSVYGASKSQEIRFLRIPFALPYFLTGMKIAGTLAPIGAITGDFLLGTSRHPGLGYLLLTYLHSGKIPAVFGIAVVACILGFVFVLAVNSLSYALLHSWHDSSEPQG